MKVKYYGYNTFVITADNTKLAIDPGGSFYIPDFFKTLIPKSEWQDVTHIIVTHGDPDHHWHTDRVAKASAAYVICNEKMVRNIKGKQLLLGPRSRGLAFTKEIDNLHTVGVGETIEVGGIQVTGFTGIHGPLPMKIGPFLKTLTPGEDERIGWGEMVYKIKIGERTIINFGDTIYLENEWKTIKTPDVLLIPIGGYNTMDVDDALKAIKLMTPKIVIPCHYNAPALFSKCANHVDTQVFESEVARIGSQCFIMSPDDEISF